MSDADLRRQGPSGDGGEQRVGAMLGGGIVGLRPPPGEEEEEDSRAESWPIGIRGVLAILFGAVALANPSATAVGLVFVFAIWAFIDGIFAIAVAVRRGRCGLDWGWFAFEGIVSLAAGAVAVAFPGLTLLTFVILVGVRAVLLGALMLGGAVAWPAVHSRGLQSLTGIVSLLFGVMLLWHPLVGGLALVWTIGIYALVIGAMLLAVALGLRSAHGPRFPTQERLPAT
jgi:uncharacterized membrane protein HdeD (DUF308 family)